MIARLLAAALMGIPALASGAEPPALEYQVKGAYLFNFAKYVEWPESAFPSAECPFVIGVLDGGEALPVLRKLLEGKSVNGHPIMVIAAPPATVPADAHILFVARSAGRDPEDVRADLGSAPTLLVGETDRFAERGGAVGFVREERTIRLSLCLPHAVASGLKVSARLASVATSVKPKPL